MKSKRVIQTFAVFMLAGVLAGCAEQTRSRMDIDPRADDALRRMSTTIGGAQSFSFRAVATMDEPVDTGQLAQFTRQNRIVVHRPDRILAEARQDDDALFLWYEGKMLTVYDKASNTYATLQVPDRIEAMLDDVAVKHGLTLPLADLLFSDPYKILTAEAYMGRYLGVADVDGIKCHHLFFTQETIDWQIWIDAGEQPLPRRFVIDYKSLPERPQFLATLSDWNLSAPVTNDQFKPMIPSDAKKVEITQALETGQGE